MAGPAWRTSAFAVVMIVIAFYCAGRLAISRLRRRETEFDADGVHVVMGVAMAGMFLPRLSVLPPGAWEAMFAVAAAWFGWRAISGRRQAVSGWWRRCSHPLPHLVECVAMCYMLLALSRSPPPGQAGGMSMAAMGGGGWNLPALAVVLALFLLGYVIWMADQIMSAPRVPAAMGIASTAVRPVLAPRLAACSKIAMSIAMGYMLIGMI
jgi:hypothetical protein